MLKHNPGTLATPPPGQEPASNRSSGVSDCSNRIRRLHCDDQSGRRIVRRPRHMWESCAHCVS